MLLVPLSGNKSIVSIAIFISDYREEFGSILLLILPMRLN